MWGFCIMQTKEIKFHHKIIKVKYRDDSDLSVIDEIFVDKMYRSAEQIISNLESPILDIGAHTGLFSVYVSTLNPNVKIFSLEPEPDNFTLMKENLKLNHCENVIVKNVALVGNDEEKVSLYLSNNSHNHTTLPPNHFTTKNPEEIKISATNLNRIISQNKLDKIGLLKMDIEGAEFEIIKALDNNIIKVIKNIVVEYHEDANNKHADIENILRSYGFSIEHFPNHFDKRFGLLVCRNKRK